MSTGAARHPGSVRRPHRRSPRLLTAALVAWCVVTGVAIRFLASRLVPDMADGLVLVLLVSFGAVSAVIIEDVVSKR